jgi:hypothetical protein
VWPRGQRTGERVEMSSLSALRERPFWRKLGCENLNLDEFGGGAESISEWLGITTCLTITTRATQ